MGRIWRGSYSCAGDTVGLEIVVADDANGLSQSILAFFPGAPEAQPVRGCYRGTGHLEGGNRLRTEAEPWVRYPADGALIDLDGRLLPTGSWSRQVSAPGCGIFQLEPVDRAQEDFS